MKQQCSKDYSDWDIENPELIETCKDCDMPNNQVVNSKSSYTGYYVCLCNWDISKSAKKCTNTFKDKEL